MTAYETILSTIEDGVAVITLNRPEVLNAMNHRLVQELHTAVSNAARDDGVGCIVVTGAGEKAFSAGGDIHEQREDDANRSQADRDERSALRARWLYEIATCPVPTIGMMNGLAYGGATVLSTTFDMRMGCERTKFRFLAAAYGRLNATWTLPNQVGWPKAKELLFGAQLVEAEEAYRIGLLNHLVPAGELRTRTMDLARTIAGNHRDCVRGIKQLMLADMGEKLGQQIANELDFTRNVVRGARAEDAFTDFIARKGRKVG